MKKITMLVSLTILLGFIVACNPNKNQKISIEKYPVTTPIIVDTTYSNEYVAEIQSIQNVEIRTKINGFIEKIHVDEGKAVKTGQLLFTINSVTFQKDLLKAKAMVKNAIAEAKNAELDLQNVKLLASKNVVSKTELEKAQANYSAALARVEEHRANQETAEIHLAMTKIRAPFNGTINRIPFKIGSLINEGTLLTTISNNNQVYAYFNVSEKEYLQIKEQRNEKSHDDITLLLANNKPHDYKGTIETIEGEFDQNTGNIAFRARFSNPKLLLKHGSSGKIQLTNSIKNALIIPQKATFEIQDKQYVFIVDKNNIVRSKNIEIQQRLQHLYVIKSGLTTNDKLIYEGIQNLKDGDTIRPQLINMKEVMSKLK
jgi:membrane fusion protein (multidrug efflux system)